MVKACFSREQGYPPARVQFSQAMRIVFSFLFTSLFYYYSLFSPLLNTRFTSLDNTRVVLPEILIFFFFTFWVNYYFIEELFLEK